MKSPNLRHCQAHSQNKGLSRASWLQTRPSPAGHRQARAARVRRGLSPPPERHPIPNCKQTSLLTKTSWDSEWLTSAQRVAVRDHPPRRNTHTHCTPKKPSGWDRGGDKSQPSTEGDSARQAPSHLSCLDLGWGKTQAQPSQCLCEVLENLNLSGLDLGSTCKPGPTSDSSRQSNLSEQCRLGKHTRCEQGQTQSC